MKRTTTAARGMTDAELQATRQILAREIPLAQQLYDAVKREANRRKRQRATSRREPTRGVVVAQAEMPLDVDSHRSALSAIVGARA